MKNILWWKAILLLKEAHLSGPTRRKCPVSMAKQMARTADLQRLSHRFIKAEQKTGPMAVIGPLSVQFSRPRLSDQRFIW
jgi:hypothetical protein